MIHLYRKNTKRTQDLWWLGLPTNVRGKVWKLAIGNDLNVTSGKEMNAMDTYNHISGYFPV